MHALVICDNPEILALHAAEAIVEIAREAISARGRFTLALSGGSTPRKTYQLLAQAERAAAIDWSKTLVFFSDERFVPTTDPRSNYRMAQEALLAYVPIPRSQVYPVPTAQISAAKAAEEYEREIRKIMALRSVDCETTREASSPDNSPRKRTIFDLILLGLGADGHTASLFPGSAALQVENAWVTWSMAASSPPPVARITFTYRLLNAARQIMFLVSGADKAAILPKVLEENANPEIYPAAGVCPEGGRVLWIADRLAAASLTPEILKRHATAAAER